VNTPFEPVAHNEEEMPQVGWFVRWRGAIVVAIVVAIVFGGVAGARQGSVGPAVTTTTLAPDACPKGSPITCYSLTRVIEKHDRGSDVRRIQQRLKDLRFDPGRIDGTYDGDTMMAVWAFQSLVMKRSRDTVVDFVTPGIWDYMRGNVVIVPRRTSTSPIPATARHVEVYLTEQALVLFKGSEVLLVSHISSGTGQKWCEEVTISPGEIGNPGKVPLTEGACGDARTPSGIYYFYNRIYGLRESKLGTLWNPVYFNFGIAIHGSMNVPKVPASKGCIRIPIFISQYFPAMVEYGDRVFVFDGVKEPEEYGSPPPIFDTKDPNYTTTTSSSTSTTTTTIAPVKTSTTVKTTLPTTSVVSTTTTTTVGG